MKANVIGSGIGGISAAIRLRNMGFNVNVFEKNKNPGGKLNTFKLGDYRFDAGPSLFTMPNLVDELFTMSGENPRNFLNVGQFKILLKFKKKSKFSVTLFQGRCSGWGLVQMRGVPPPAGH